MRIEMLEDIFNEAQRDGWDICVEITIPGQKDTEFIINRNASIENKLEYYKENYNKNCIHKKNSEIKIVSATGIKFDCQI